MLKAKQRPKQANWQSGDEIFVWRICWNTFQLNMWQFFHGICLGLNKSKEMRAVFLEAKSKVELNNNKKKFHENNKRRMHKQHVLYLLVKLRKWWRTVFILRTEDTFKNRNMNCVISLFIFRLFLHQFFDGIFHSGETFGRLRGFC